MFILFTSHLARAPSPAGVPGPESPSWAEWANSALSEYLATARGGHRAEPLPKLSLVNWTLPNAGTGRPVTTECEHYDPCLVFRPHGEQKQIAQVVAKIADPRGGGRSPFNSLVNVELRPGDILFLPRDVRASLLCMSLDAANCLNLTFWLPEPMSHDLVDDSRQEYSPTLHMDFGSASFQTGVFRSEGPKMGNRPTSPAQFLDISADLHPVFVGISEVSDFGVDAVPLNKALYQIAERGVHDYMEASGAQQFKNNNFFDWQKDLFDEGTPWTRLYKSKAFKMLKKLLLKAAKVALVKFGLDPATVNGLLKDIGRMHVWATFLQRGLTTHDQHLHRGAGLSMVYYVNFPAGAGQLFFFDPKGPYPPYTHRFTLRPQPASFVSFPSWVLHGVESSTCEEPRISYAVNLPGNWSWLLQQYIDMQGQQPRVATLPRDGQLIPPETVSKLRSKAEL